MIEKLNPHYSMNNPASIYDEEALTALELAARIARKVNEVVDSHNELTKVSAEFREELTLKIAKAIEGLPLEVVATVNSYLEDGVFDDAIDQYAGVLSARLSEAISGLTQDSEVIDARIDNKGQTYGTLGSHLRRTEAYYDSIVKDIARFKVVDCPLTVYTTAVKTDGSMMAQSENAACGRLEVNGGELYYIKAYYGYDYPDAVVYDENMNFVQFFNALSGQMRKELCETPIMIPPEGKYLYINWFENYEIAAKNLKALRVEGWRPNTDELETFVKNLLFPNESLNTIYTKMAITNGMGNNVLQLQRNEEVTLQRTTDTNSGYFVSRTNVEAGQRIRFTCAANFGNAFYALIREDGGTYKYALSEKTDDLQTLTVDMVVPIGVAGVYVASKGQIAFVEKLSSYANSTKVWSHLKWACIGDSITEHNTRAAKSYDTYIEEKTGIKIQNLGVSGAGYRAEENANTCMYQLAMDVAEDTNVVTIMAGVNDNQYMGNMGEPNYQDMENGLLGYVYAAYEEARYKAPNAVIGIISPPPIKGQSTMNAGCNLEKFSDKLGEFCRYYGIPYLDLFHLVGGTLRPDEEDSGSTYYKNDRTQRVHPDEDGHRVISSFVYKFLDELIGTY